MQWILLSCIVLEALKGRNTYQAAFVVYKTPGQKHCLTDLLHCPFQRWNPRDRILDPICKTGKLINSYLATQCFPAAFSVQGCWGKRRTQILPWLMCSSPGKPSSNRGSTGHSFIPHLADGSCLTQQELLSSPSCNFPEHHLCFPELHFGALLSHQHFLPSVPALVNWTKDSKLDTRSPQSWGKDLFHSLLCSRAGESGHGSEEPKSVKHTESWGWHQHKILSPPWLELLHSVKLWTNTWNPYKVTFNFPVIKQKESSTSPTKLLLLSAAAKIKLANVFVPETINSMP